MNNENSTIKVVFQQLPTYLQDFFPNRIFNEINLVYLNNLKHEKTLTSDSTLNIKGSNTLISETTLELTGNPLIVDLNREEFFFSVSEVEQWTEIENTHLPMPIYTAREYLNREIEIKTEHAEFIVCDGKDEMKTIVLGAKESPRELFTCSINICGYYPKTTGELTLEIIEKGHNLLSKKKSKIDYLGTYKYFMFDKFLENIQNISFKHYVNCCIKATSSSRCFVDKFPSSFDEMEILLQVIAGQKYSSAYSIWEDLEILQKYLDIMEDNDINESTEICPNPLSEEEIDEIINNFIGLTLETEVQEFTLEQSSRQLTFTDIWNTLKYCQNVKVLKNAIFVLFEEVSKSQFLRKIDEGNTSNVAQIINNLIDGNLRILTLSHAQALEFLFEVGTEKLKYNFQEMWKKWYSPYTTKITQEWNRLLTKQKSPPSVKKSRLTHLLLNSNEVDTKICEEKLGYLSQLYLKSELNYLVHSINTSEVLSSELYKKISENTTVGDTVCGRFKNLVNNRLFECTIPLRKPCVTLIEDKSPDFFSLKMISHVDNFKAETVHIFSTYSIIPPTIYNDYNEHERTKYYVYKMESYTDC